MLAVCVETEKGGYCRGADDLLECYCRETGAGETSVRHSGNGKHEGNLAAIWYAGGMREKRGKTRTDARHFDKTGSRGISSRVAAHGRSLAGSARNALRQNRGGHTLQPDGSGKMVSGFQSQRIQRIVKTSTPCVRCPTRGKISVEIQR